MAIADFLATRLGALLGKLVSFGATSTRRATIGELLRQGYRNPEAFEVSKEIAQRALRDYGAETRRLFPLYDVDRALAREVTVHTMSPGLLKVLGQYHPVMNIIDMQGGLPEKLTRDTLAHEATHAIFRPRLFFGGYLRGLSRKNPVPGELTDRSWRSHYGRKLELDPRLAELKRRMVEAGQLGPQATWQNVLAGLSKHTGETVSDAGLAANVIAKASPETQEVLAKRLLQLLGIGGAAAAPTYALTRENRT